MAISIILAQHLQLIFMPNMMFCVLYAILYVANRLCQLTFDSSEHNNNSNTSYELLAPCRPLANRKDIKFTSLPVRQDINKVKYSKISISLMILFYDWTRSLYRFTVSPFYRFIAFQPLVLFGAFVALASLEYFCNVAYTYVHICLYVFMYMYVCVCVCVNL